MSNITPGPNVEGSTAGLNKKQLEKANREVEPETSKMLRPYFFSVGIQTWELFEKMSQLV
jgi:hypothetical protein